MTAVIGTAGHIDHGKTALLRALTGIDADRLPEERRRGMTIDVGYAHLRLPDGSDVDFVDVPGHDRLIGNMLVGAGEIDAALLVIAADDGPRAQTVEHLSLLDGLGLDLGIVALTKVDVVDPGRVAEVEAQVRALLAGTSLAGSPILPVSSIDGRGLAELLAALVQLRDRIVARAPARALGDPVRLSIDRSFVIKGRGTVVTGSLRGGRLERGVLLRLVPGDHRVRVREVQVHGGPVDGLTGGGRVALNLVAIAVAELPRGAVLTTDPAVRSTSALIVELTAASRPGDGGAEALAPGAVFRLHLGTEQVQATLGRGRADRAPTRGGMAVRLRLARPIAVAPGDRFVLRRGSSGARVTGGRVLDPEPPVGPSRRHALASLLASLAAAQPAERARAFVAIHRVVDPRTLAEVAGAGPGIAAEAIGAIPLAGMLVAEPIAGVLAAEALAAAAGPGRGSAAGPGVSLAELRARLVRALRRLATVGERDAGAIVDAMLAGLVDAGRLSRTAGQLRAPGQSAALPASVSEAMDRLERALATAGPPALAEAARLTRCPPEGVRALESAGRIVRIDESLAYAAGTYRELAEAAVRMAAGEGLTPAAYRDMTGTSRRYVLAILEDLDRRGILRRTASGHVPGPRAALVAEIGRATR